MNIIIVQNSLSRHINSTIVTEIINEYKETKSSFWVNDYLKTLLYAARFSELCIYALEFLSNPKIKVDLNSIHFNRTFEKLIRLPKKSAAEELLYLVIPQTLKSIYTIRSKKKVAHFKKYDLHKIDAELVLVSCDWIFSQFLLLYHNSTPQETIRMIDQLMKKKIPTIEEFEDGQFMILKGNLLFGDELLLWLYHFNKRMTNKELIELIKPKNTSYISTYTNKLYKKTLIHKNENGSIINKNGILKIEQNKDKYFNI